MTLLRGFVIWVIIMLAEVLHGIARGALLEPYVGDFRARQISVFTGSAIILAIALVTVRWLHAEGIYQLIGVGVLWLGLTLSFEIILGRFVMGYTWERIGSDYNLFAGGLLPIGLLVLTTAPFIAAKVRGAIRSAR
jgi:hypothetical protein